MIRLKHRPFSIGWLFCTLLLTLVASPFGQRPAVAAEPSVVGSVTVRVVDDISKTPIPRAGVRVVTDSREYDGLTDANGTARFPEIIPGVYGIIVAEPDFAFTKTYAITTKPGEATTVTVLGTRTGMRKIGYVQAHAQTRSDAATAVGAESAAAVLSGSAGASLGSLPAAGTGPNASLAIHNEGPGLTSATINGAPIFASGSRIPVALFSGDIFSSAGLASGAIGAPDGSLNFQTYGPTIDWSGILQTRGASFGSTSGAIQERGTFGRLGVAVVHAQNSSVSAIDGTTFADTSGVGYSHHAAQQSNSDTLTLRYGFAQTNTAYLDLGRLDLASDLYCNVQTGPTPCGFGPGNKSRRTVVYRQIRDDFTPGNATINLNLFSSSDSDTYDFANELVEGQNVGSFSQSAARRTGAIVKIAYPLATNRVASITFSSVSDVVTSGGLGTAAQPLPVSAQSHSALTLDVPILHTRQAQMNLSAGTNAGGGVSKATFGANASYALTVRDSLTAAFTSGQLSSALPGFNGIDPAELLQVDCSSARAEANGPTTSSLPGSTQQIRLGFLRSMLKYQIKMDAFHDVAYQGLITGIVPSTALSGGLLNSAYLQTANTIASRECGFPISFRSTDLFYTVTGPVTQLVNDGIDTGVTYDINPRTSISVANSISLERGYGASALFVPGSTVSPGRAIPMAPVSRINASARYATSRSTTAIVNLNAISGNNPYSGHALTSIDVGLRSKFRSGDFVVSLQNVTNAGGNTFATFDSFPILRQPYAPRTFSIRARIAVGREDIDRADYLTKPLVIAAGSVFFVPADFGPAPEQGWLAPATDTPFCGPEVLSKAKKYLADIARFDNDARQTIERPSKAIPSQTLGDIRVSEVMYGPAGYVLQIHLERAALAPFLRCSVVHTGTFDQGRALGLYQPTWQQREEDGINVVYYSPQVGLYFAPDPLNETRAAVLPLSVLPEHAPADPFLIVEGCPPSLAPAVNDSVLKLKSYIDGYYRGTKSPTPDGFSISAHVARAETWLEIRPDNRAVSDALSQCLRIPSVELTTISQRGLSAAFAPSINYAPSVGFYRRN